MTYARLRSRWTGRALVVGPFADAAEARAFAPGLSQERAEMPTVVVDDRAVLEAAGALPIIDYDVEVFE